MNIFACLRHLALAAFVPCAAPGASYAQPYPAKPLRMVVPFAPGGGTDVIARYVAAGMIRALNVKVQ